MKGVKRSSRRDEGEKKQLDENEVNHLKIMDNIKNYKSKTVRKTF